MIGAKDSRFKGVIGLRSKVYGIRFLSFKP